MSYGCGGGRRSFSAACRTSSWSLGLSLQEGVVPHGDAVVVCGRQMRYLEVRALESTDALGNPRDLLADDCVGRVQGLRKHAYRLGGLPVFVRDVAANALAPAWLGLDRPIELEPVVPALHQGGRGSGRGQVRARGPTRRRDDG